MGQCMSRKAAGAFAASAAAAHNRPAKMQKHKNMCQSPDDENNKSQLAKKQQHPAYGKGVATSFGFKRRPATAPSIAPNSSAARRLANADIIIVDSNGNNGDVATTDVEADTSPLTSNAAPTGRSTPRLAPPKKEASATTRVSRFGFRQPHANRTNKVADLNTVAVSSGPATVEFSNNNNAVRCARSGSGGAALVKPKLRTVASSTAAVVVSTDANRNKTGRTAAGTGVPHGQMGRFTLHSVQLPQPEMPVRLLESKTAKTLANTSKKEAGAYQHDDNASSKDGSLTEDSGLGSHFSGGNGDLDNCHRLEHMDRSPTFGVRGSFRKHRNLEMVISGNKFDVVDLDETSENSVPLPRLPSAFHVVDNNRSSYYNNGSVKDRTLDYQRHLDRDNRRKNSVTSSEGFSDDYCDEEKSYKDRFRSEKTFIKPSHKSFLKVKTDIKDDSSTLSSDEQEWTHGGEAMAEEISFSISSSDESKDKDHNSYLNANNSINAKKLDASLHSFMAASISKSFPKADIKNVLLTIEDPKFAAVAAMAASSSKGLMLEEETSPVDSLISCSESEELKKKPSYSSDSKDINEKLTPPSPGTPTHATNSLSLSDGKDDFLIDDEIADQPALVFEDAIQTVNDTFSMSHSNSDTTQTIVDSTPKPKRRSLGIFDGSPLMTRSKRFINSRTGSLDTLSPCESIASDDLMLDFEYSQSSGLEDCDRDKHNTSIPSIDDTLTTTIETDCRKDVTLVRDWTSLLSSFTPDRASLCNTRTSRLLLSRTGTPTSIPDSPRSLDRQASNRTRPPTATNSPFRQRRSLVLSECDSDDSARQERANHAAIKQDMMSIKTMLLKLRRVLNEQVDEEMLMRSETHNPFSSQLIATNGLFNGCSNSAVPPLEDGEDTQLELAELRKQVLFLQGQLEDKEKTVQCLQEEMHKLVDENYTSNSAPASSISIEHNVINAATQTERVRPISAGPSLMNGTPVDGSASSLVSASETASRKSRPQVQCDSPSSPRKTQSRLWRKPGEPPSPPRYTTTTSSIPRRANSRTRAPSTQS